jgi:hypothetical protein
MLHRLKLLSTARQGRAIAAVVGITELTATGAGARR